MITEESEEDLLERAKAEEKAYNWIGAVKLYENAAKSYFNKNMIRKAAETYKKLGYAYEEAAHTVNTAGRFIEFRNSAANAFKEAMNLFITMRDKPEELECEALALYINGTITKSNVESKRIFSDSYELMMNANELYSKKNDQESILRILSYAALTLWCLCNCCIDLKEYYQYSQKCTELAKKCWNLSKKANNVRFQAESLLTGYNSLIGEYFGKNIQKNKYLEKNLWETLSRCEESLIKIKDCDDFKALGKVYYVTGLCCFLVGFHLITDVNEQEKYFNKALELLERAVIFSKKSKNKHMIIDSLFYVNYVALNARKIEFLQRRISDDIKDMTKSGEIYARQGYYSIAHAFSNLLPSMYYTSIAQMSFFKPAQRTFYAAKGIEYAEIALNKWSSFNPSLPYITWPLMFLTFSYLTLTTLTPEKNKRDQYVQQMLQFANQTSNISEKFEEGLAKSAGYLCLYGAYKTLAEITEKQEEKIKMLSAAADVQKKYIPHALESRTGIIGAKMRLGLLYEELSIVTGKINPLMEAKEVFFEDSSE